MVRPAKGGTEFPEPSSWKTIPPYTFTHSVPKGAYVRYLLFRTCSVHGCVRLCTTSVPTQLLSTLDLPPKVSNTCVHAHLQPTTGASDLVKTKAGGARLPEAADFACGAKGGGGTARGSVPGAGLSRLIRASIDWVLWERRGGKVPAPHQGTTLVRGARAQENRKVVQVLQTTTRSPRRFNTPSHKRRNSRWYFYYRMCHWRKGYSHFETA